MSTLPRTKEKVRSPPDTSVVRWMKEKSASSAPTRSDAKRSNMNELPISNRPFLINWQERLPVGGNCLLSASLGARTAETTSRHYEACIARIILPTI